MIRPRYVVIVRRDREEILRVFEEYYAGSKFAVLRDRRGHDRRGVQRRVRQERRQAERRAPPASSWEALGYIVIRHELP